jgi:phosphoribosylanthranilate isomerase
MLIKVCGMRNATNIEALCQLKPDFVGFIFYNKSPRYAVGILTREVALAIPKSILKTGVFVNEEYKAIKQVVAEYELGAVQLHGSETPDLCARLKDDGLMVLKAFHPNSIEELQHTYAYNSVCDYFLFDTPSVNHGGTGVKFDWSILEHYSGACPFFLSGGIGVNDAKQILALTNISPVGVDINSKFEIEPGLKNIDEVSKFFHVLKNNR